MKALQRSLDATLPACMVGTLLAVVYGLELGLWIARPAIALYLLQHWPQLPGMGRLLLSATVATALGLLLMHSDPWPIVLAGWDSLSFFATFITSLGLLRVAAVSSPLVRAAGYTLVRQKPSQRYPTLSLGTALFGMIINVGVLSLFTTMVSRSNTLQSANGSAAVQEARERRMALAILRGFALAPIISPLSVTLAIILSALPQLTWTGILPITLPMAVLFFFLGWAADWWQRPKHLAAQVSSSLPATAPPLTPLYRFSGLVGLITLSVFAVAVVLHVPLPTAVLIACPLCAFIWLAVQRKRLNGGLGVKRASSHVLRNAYYIFASSRNEVALLGASAALGTLLTPLINEQALAVLLQQWGVQGVTFAVLAMGTVVLFAQIGVNPIVSATLVASLFPDTSLIHLHPGVLALALMCAWSLSMITSPFTASLTLVSEQIHRSSYQVGWRWNAVFFFLLLPVIIAWLHLAQWLLG